MRDFLRGVGRKSRVFLNPYRVTALGHRVALCYCRTHRRVLAPVLAAVADDRSPPELGRLVRRFDRHVDRLWEGQKLAARKTWLNCIDGRISRTSTVQMAGSQER